MVADASFPDRQGLGLREQPSAGLGQLLAGCRAKERPQLTRCSGPGRPCPHPREPLQLVPLGRTVHPCLAAAQKCPERSLQPAPSTTTFGP